jgi:carboxypeptidase family protein
MNAGHVVRVSLLLTAWAISLQGQSAPPQPPREARAGIHGTGVLSGTVVSDEAQPRPIRHARVTVGSSALAFARTAMTDDRGRFTIQDLPAGRYAVSASKDAWVTTAYGARRPQRPGTPVAVGDGQKAVVTIRMLRGAVITGVVTDPAGQPEGNVLVRAMRYSFQNGERRLTPFGNGTSDDRGVYRMWGLPPGDYIVGGTSRAVPSGIVGADLRLTTDLDVRQASSETPQPSPPDRTVSLSTTYYPGTALASQAGLVSVNGGEERGGIDITLQLVPAVRIEGSLAFPSGQSDLAASQVNLTAGAQASGPAAGFEGFRSTRPGPDGTFAFVGITPGPYTVLARSTVRPPEGSPPGTQPLVLWAIADLAVEGDNVSGLALMLQPAMTVTGRLAFDGASLAPPVDLKSVRVTLQPVQPQGGASMAPGNALMESDGRFSVPGIVPGRYRLSAALPGPPRAGGWVLRSATINGQDTLDFPITLQPGQPVNDALVTFSDHPAELTGSLQNAAGGAAPDYTVILFPADQTMWIPQSRRIQAVRPSPDGAFTIRNLPAGTYLLAAVDDVEPGEWYDASFLQRLQPLAMAVAIAEGEKKVQDVQVSR